MSGRVLLVSLLVLGLAACADDGNDGYVAPGQRVVTETAEPDPPAPASTSTVPTMPDDASTASSLPSEPLPEVVPASGVSVRVIAIDNSFRPETIEVAVGDDVTWENRGMNEHNILSIEGPAPGSPVGDSESIGWIRDADDRLSWGVTTADFQPGSTFTYRFAEPGEYHYYCAIHGTATVGMVGVVVVTD